MGGRYDATNVVPSPVACGVAMLDLDHTQVEQNTDRKCCRKRSVARLFYCCCSKGEIMLPLCLPAHSPLYSGTLSCQTST